MKRLSPAQAVPGVGGEARLGVTVDCLVGGSESSVPSTRHGKEMPLMPAISRDEVAHLAGLARIEMSDAELDRMAGQLDVILGAVAQVQEVAGDDVPATSHPMPLVNVTRPDEPRPGLSAEQALAGAPAQQEQRFRVPRILEED